MKLHGSTEGNLISAVRSASRFRGQPVHRDTVHFWADLVAHARNELSIGNFASDHTQRLLLELEREVNRRAR